ncbi:MAG: hypothetical protein ABUL42_02830 [Terricaulis silvestris]
MPRPEDSQLPQHWTTDKGQAIIVYTSPAQQQEAATRSAAGILFVLAVLTLCGIVAGICAWRTWGPGGIVSRITAQQSISEEARGLGDYRNALARQNAEMARQIATNKIQPPAGAPQHGLVTGQVGIDAQRIAFDRACTAVTVRTPGADACIPAAQAPRCVWAPADDPPTRRCAAPPPVGEPQN